MSAKKPPTEKKLSKRVQRTPTYQALRARTTEIQQRLNAANGKVTTLTAELAKAQEELEKLKSKKAA